MASEFDFSGTRRDLLLGAGAAAGLLLSPSGRSLAAAAPPQTSGVGVQGDYLIKGGYVLSVDPEIGDLPVGDVHVRNGVIQDIGRRLSAPGAEVIDAGNAIVMPGFIEVHWHMWNSIWRGMAHDATEYFGLHRLAEFYTEKDHYTAVRYASAEAINAGLTTCHNWAHGIRNFEDAASEIRALIDSGIRARFGYGDTLNGVDKSIGESELSRAQEYLRGRDGGRRVTLGLVIHNSKALPDEVAAARKLGLKSIGPHADYSSHPELVGPDFIYTHGAGASREVLANVARSGAKVGLCPLTDPLVGGGWPPLQEMLAAGVPFENIGFSVDVSCQTSVDPFQSMRILMFSARIAQTREAGLNGFGDISGRRAGAPLMLPRKLIELATINGARVLGVDDVTGSLKPGKRADLIVVRTDRINMLPADNTNPTFQLVQHGQPADVDTVLVDGRILKRDGRLVGVDPVQLSHEAAAAQKAIRERSGLQAIDTTR
jgi:5-methylthioadenosine/S-adenosylhomocysteine deaminase